MSSIPSPQILPQTAETEQPIDRGLRSLEGIRWLLLVGASVVAVSVVRLVAAQWGSLPLAAQFLVLAAGALSLFAAGDVAQRRLGLRAAGSALLFLFAAIVPLWAWGAAFLGLLAAPFGWASFALGLTALFAACERTIRQTLGYRGFLYPAALGVFLLALPVLPFLERRFAGGEEGFFLVAAIAFGLVLRAASRHVNRFFFHRDRVAGLDRPVHCLPFALLALVYGAGMSLLGGFAANLALPLVFVAVALIDTGEEYYLASVRAGGARPERWPRRSVGLLAVGFATLAAALVVAPVVFAGGLRSTAVVMSVGALRLIAWALRYRSTSAYVFGLIAGVVAYHFAPVLIPDAIRELFHLAVRALGIAPGSPAVVSLGDLGLLAALLTLGVVLRRRLTPAMARAHGVVTAVDAALLLLLGWTDPLALRTIAPAAALLLAAGIVRLRQKELIPALYLALASLGIAWTWAPFDPLWHVDAALAVGGINLVFLAAGILAVRRAGLAGEERRSWVRLFAWPPMLATLALVPVFFEHADPRPIVAGLLALLTAGTLAALFLLRGRIWLVAGAAVALSAGLERVGYGLAGETAASLALVLAAFAQLVLAETLSRGGRKPLARSILTVAILSGLLGGWTALDTTTSFPGSPWFPILPAFLASLLFVLMALRDAALRDAAVGDTALRDAALRESGGLDDLHRTGAALLAMGFFAASLSVLVDALATFGREVHFLSPGLALLGLSGLLRHKIGRYWSQHLFTAGAGCLYAMPVMGLLDEVSWVWQAVLLLFAVAFGAASFRLRSRSLLTVSTAALVIDLAFFLIKLRQTEPMLLWAAGIVFGLGLMALAALLEHRREAWLQHLRIWGQEIRSWA